MVMRLFLFAILALERGTAFQHGLRHGQVRFPASTVKHASVEVQSSKTSLHAMHLPINKDAPKAVSSTFRIRKTLLSLFGRVRRWTKRAIAAAFLFFVVNFASINPAFARSGARMGGSFKPRPPPMSRPMPRSSSHHLGPSRGQQPRMIIHRSPHVHVHSPTGVVQDSAVVTRAYAAPPRRMTMSDVVLVSGVGTVVGLNVVDRLSKDGKGGKLESSLGPGVSVVSMTVALNVPDRDSPNSALARLSRLALTARTDSRRGVQDLITETALELLRQKHSIVSADSTYSHFRRVPDAEREFNTLSIGGRSKFDEESVSNYGGKKVNRTPYAAVDGYPRATVAVVTINLCIEGDSTKVSQIRNRVELESALSRIASDSQVDDCLLAAEVLWSPESRTERITSEDIYADYPSLFPI